MELNVLERTRADTEVLENTLDSTPVEDTHVLEEAVPVPYAYPKGIELGLISMAVGLSLVLTGLDETIVATAVPSITSHFGTYADVGWYSSAYRLTLCAFQFMFGKIYKIFPLKTVFLGSLAIFELGSALCGGAPTSLTFILGRAVAGFGAAGVVAGCFSLLTITVPLRYRPMAAGLGGTAEGVSTVIAPTVGGLITGKLGWRWCFYINLPFGAVTLLILAVFFKEPRRRSENSEATWKQKLSQLDLFGTAVLIPSVTCLFLALAWAGSKYSWSDRRIIVLFIVASILFVAFAWIQYQKGDNATLPLRIVRQRSIYLGFVFSCCNNAAMNVMLYYLPTYLQTIKSMSAWRSGLMLMPCLGGFVIAMLVAGSTISSVGFYVPFMLVTSTLAPIAAGLLTTLNVETNIACILGYTTFLGIADGIGFQSPQFAVQTTLSEEDAQLGLAVILFAQYFGPAVFVTVAQTIFSGRIVSNLERYAPDVNSTALEKAGLSDLSSHVRPEELGVVLQSYDKAITQTFYLGVGLLCLTMMGSVGMPWRSVKEKRS